jgi:FSR family fosmidomycin resistance protein-like MFS transporter
MTPSKPIFPYLTLLGLSVTHFFVDFMIGIWPVFKTLEGLDIAVAGLIYAFCSTLGEGSQLLFGQLSDKGWRKFLILSGILLASGSAFFVFASSYLELFLLFFAVCLGSGAFHPSAVGLVARLSRRRKSFCITHFAAFGVMGFAFSQIVYSAVYETFQRNTLFLVIPLALMALLFTLPMMTREPKGYKTPDEPPSFKLFGEFFRMEGLRNLYGFQVANQTLMWTTIFILPDILKFRAFPDAVVYGGGHFFFMLGGVLLLIPSGIIADRFSSRSIILTASFLGMMIFYAFLLIPDVSTPAVLSLLFALGATMGIVSPVSIALGHKLRSDHPGMVSAFLMGGVWCVSECIGPASVGLLTKIFDEDAAARALMVVGSFFALSLYFALKLPAQVAEETVVDVE